MYPLYRIRYYIMVHVHTGAEPGFKHWEGQIEKKNFGGPKLRK
jgi:hypothetical protein